MSIFSPMSSRENSDLMNKGLRRRLRLRNRHHLTPYERILTWWIKDCDYPDTPRVLWVSNEAQARENSDLMNKGLRQPPNNWGFFLRMEGERILTWWIKDCDARTQPFLNTPYPRENSDLMNKGLRRPHPALPKHPVPKREFWLDE